MTDAADWLVVAAAVCFSLAAYNALLGIVAGVLFVLDAVSSSIWVGLFGLAASLFGTIAGLIAYYG